MGKNESYDELLHKLIELLFEQDYIFRKYDELHHMKVVGIGFEIATHMLTNKTLDVGENIIRI